MNTEMIISNTDVLDPASEVGSNRLPFEKEATIALFALVEALSYEVMSGDLWWLANHSARKNAIEKYGISEEAYDAVMEKVEKARKQVRKGNPMHTMF